MKREATLNRQKMLRYVLQGVALGALATIVVLALTLREDTFARLREFSPRVLPLLFGMVVVAWLCNGARVWLMCRAAGHPLKFRQTIAVSLSTEFGIASTPAGLGGTVIRLTLLRQAGVPLSTSGSLLATDAAVDVVFFALLAPFAIFYLLHDGLLQAVTGTGRRTDSLIALGIVLALVVGLLLLLSSRRFHQLVARAAAATAWGRRKRLVARHRLLRINTRRGIRQMLGSLGFLWRERRGALLLNFLCASLQWCCRYMLLPIILYSLGCKVNPLPLFLAQGFLFALSLLVVVPGGGGSVELLTAIILPSVAPPHIIGVVVLVWRFFTYHLYILGGGAMFFYACHRMHRLFPQSLPSESAKAPGEVL